MIFDLYLNKLILALKDFRGLDMTKQYISLLSILNFILPIGGYLQTL